MKKLWGKMDSFKEIIRGYERLRWQKTAELRNMKSGKFIKRFHGFKEIEEAVSLTGISDCKACAEAAREFFPLAGRCKRK